MTEYQTIQEEQISTKELIKKIIGVFTLIGSQWKLLLIGAAIGALISILLDIKNRKETQYNGEVQFNLESGGSGQNQMGGLGGLASAFGMTGMGNTTTNDLFSGGNFGLMVSSKALYEKALMKEVIVGGKKTLFINFYKDSSDIAKKEWGGDLFHEPDTKSIKYRFQPKNPSDFTKAENIIIATIFEKLETQTELRSLDKNGSIMILSHLSNSELLTKIWLETLLQSLKEFYIEVRTQKTREIYDIQVNQLRQLEGKLNSTDRQLATATFQNQNAVDPTAPMKQLQLNRSNTFISNQYYAQMATVEQLKMALIHQTPLFTVLQPVRLPLLKKNYIIGGNTISGALLGFFLFLIYVIIRKTYVELMN